METQNSDQKDQPMSADRASDASAWTPLRRPVFRALWIASVFSNVGTWMQDVGGAWLMTMLAPSPIMVALMQTATTLPIFLLSLPAGALADVIDRRRLLLFCQAWMMSGAALLGVLTMSGVTTPLVLLVLTFVLQMGGAMSMPAYQAVVPELVSRADLHKAVALGAIAFNLARAVGPALGGLIVAAFGPGAVFLLNAASFLGVVVVIYRWQRTAPESALPTERFLNAMRAGIRYVVHAPELHSILIRTVLFAFCGSALWALLPLFASRELGLSSFGYGVLLGCLGSGAVVAALILPKMRRRFSVGALVGGAQLLYAAVLVGLAFTHNVLLVGLAMGLGGVAWISLLATFNSEVQVVIPSWVRGRVMATYGIVFFGGLAGGSVLWGAVALFAGTPATFVSAALGLASGLVFVMRMRLPSSEGLDLRPSVRSSSHPDWTVDTELDSGPVLVTIEYRIDPRSASQFARAMQSIRRIRLRNGAMQWGLFCDTKDAGRYVELFIVESWLEHLRQHERFTVSDRATEKLLRSFHVGEDPPVVSHMLYAYGLEPRP
ncbi:MAG: arabinose efflux permease family protein [Deltaproteobacteria bacterium]|nr:arabinose efflux permease family protein [Deltaproteobacteria bacterium]